MAGLAVKTRSRRRRRAGKCGNEQVGEDEEDVYEDDRSHQHLFQPPKNEIKLKKSPISSEKRLVSESQDVLLLKEDDLQVGSQVIFTSS